MKSVFLLPLMLIATLPVLAQTETEAKINVKVENSKGEAMPEEEIIFTNSTTGQKYSDVTDEEGTFSILVPKGSEYSVSYRTFTDAKEYSKIEIPDVEGYVNFDFKLVYELPKVITLKNVFFDTGKSTLKSSSNEALNNLFSFMQTKKKMRIEVAGHTDNVGDEGSNQTLSQKRAESVKKYLVDRGIDPSRIVAKGYGESKPIATNATPEGRQKNRRTEVRILN